MVKCNRAKVFEGACVCVRFASTAEGARMCVCVCVCVCVSSAGVYVPQAALRPGKKAGQKTANRWQQQEALARTGQCCWAQRTAG